MHPANRLHKKNTLYKEFIKHRTTEKEQRYKKYKNKLTGILRKAEKHYNSLLLEKHSKNIKETWRVLNGIIKKRDTNSNYPDSFVNEDKHIVDKKIISLVD